MSLVEKKIRQCTKDIIARYNESRIVPEFVRVSYREDTDGSFVQIYYRPLLDKKDFADPTVYLDLGSIGRVISRGEVRYFVARILENLHDVSQVDVAEFSPSLVIQSVLPEYPPDRVLLLIPHRVLYTVMLRRMREWPVEYDNEMKSFVYLYGNHRIPLHSVHRDFIGSRVIGLAKDIGLWMYKIFRNPYEPEKMETISVRIEEPSEEPSKFDLLIRSVIKFEIRHEKLIRIIDLSRLYD